MLRISTKYKIALGYILLFCMFVTTTVYVYNEISILTYNNDDEVIISQRRRIANNIINHLNRAEIIGQSLSTGAIDQFASYKKAMKQASNAVDSLQELTDDTLQLKRLNSVLLLINQKKKNTRNLLYVIAESDANAIYKEHIERIINEQDSLLNLPIVRRKTVVRTEKHTTPSKQKSFFKRLGEVFVPTKSDSIYIDSTIKEVYKDTLLAEYNPADTIALLLRDVQNKAISTHQQQMQKLSKQIQKLRLNSLELNRKVHHLLQTIENEDEAIYQKQLLQHKDIRNRAAQTVAGIAVIGLSLSIIFLTVIWRDITRSIHYRNELEKAKQRAEELLSVREKMMLTITHDIKAPVGSILGYTELMERIIQEERERFYLENIQNSANHLLNLVNSLLDFHRLDAEKMETVTVAFNPKELFDSLSTGYIPISQSKDLQFIYECEDSLNSTFGSDPLRIRQITDNLLSNAFKFTSEGYVELRISLKDDKLCINIVDSGYGIPQEEKDKIFLEFTRLNSAQGAEGVGLGLAITKKLVSLLNGEITVESEMGKGTSFCVQIPMDRIVTSAESHHLPDCTVTNIPSIHLLLIDDDNLQLQLTVAMLKHPNIIVKACTHPDELFKELKEKDYDIIMTDIQMPAMNGFELLKNIREHEGERAKNIPVIAITARSDMSNEQFVSQGFAGCIYKPFTQKELFNKIIETTAKEEEYKFDSLTAFSLNDSDAALEILQTFVIETEKKIESLKQAAIDREIKQAANIAHQLLPLFKMLNATQSIQPLIWLEQRGNENIFPPVAFEKIDTIIDESRKILESADKIIKEIGKKD